MRADVIGTSSNEELDVIRNDVDSSNVIGKFGKMSSHAKKNNQFMASTLFKGRYNRPTAVVPSQTKPNSSSFKKAKAKATQGGAAAGQSISAKKSFAGNDETTTANTTSIKYISHPLKMLVIK